MVNGGKKIIPPYQYADRKCITVICISWRYVICDSLYTRKELQTLLVQCRLSGHTGHERWRLQSSYLPFHSNALHPCQRQTYTPCLIWKASHFIFTVWSGLWSQMSSYRNLRLFGCLVQSPSSKSRKSQILSLTWLRDSNSWAVIVYLVVCLCWPHRLSPGTIISEGNSFPTHGGDSERPADWRCYRKNTWFQPIQRTGVRLIHGHKWACKEEDTAIQYSEFFLSVLLLSSSIIFTMLYSPCSSP